MSLASTFRLWFLPTVAAVLCASPVTAEAEMFVHDSGISFTIPPTLKRTTAGDPRAVAVWVNVREAVGVTVIAQRHDARGAQAAAAEFSDWPASGRSMAAGVGNRSTRMYREQLKAECSYEGIPVRHDVGRMLAWVQVDVTCSTSPVTKLRISAIDAITSTDNVMIRIDSTPGDPEADTIIEDIWRSFRNPRAPAASPGAEHRELAAVPVTGSKGLRLTDYGLINPAYLVGDFIGASFAAVFFGGLFSWMLMRVGVKPNAALALAQAMIIGLRMWTDSHDGIWELNWIVAFPTAAMAISILYRWAHGKWAQWHPQPSPGALVR